MKSFIAALILTCVFSVAVNAQNADPSSAHTGTKVPNATTSGSTDLASQLAELRSAVARLEASISANQRSKNNLATNSGMGNMGAMMDDMMSGPSAAGGMGGMGPATDDMDQMPPNGARGGMPAMTGMESQETSMEMGAAMVTMGQQAGSGLLRTSSLPGFPGASHIYHIGSTGFFLDHPEHVSLDTTQQQELNRIKQSALLERASVKRQISEAEQQLWELTGADQPEAERIRTKVEEIAKLRTEQRLNFIGAVGEAAKILTDAQRQSLLGLASPEGQPPHAHTHPSK